MSQELLKVLGVTALATAERETLYGQDREHMGRTVGTKAHLGDGQWAW